MFSGAPDEDAREKDEEASDDDLKNGGQERGVHVAPTDPGDRDEFDDDDRNGDTQSGSELRDQEGEGVKEPPQVRS